MDRHQFLVEKLLQNSAHMHTHTHIYIYKNVCWMHKALNQGSQTLPYTYI